jgi:hypothetical protein
MKMHNPGDYEKFMKEAFPVDESKRKSDRDIQLSIELIDALTDLAKYGEPVNGSCHGCIINDDIVDWLGERRNDLERAKGE